MKKTLFLILCLLSREAYAQVIPYNAAVSLLQMITQANMPVVVKFFLGSCGPCQRMKAHIEKLSHELAGKVFFIEVDIKRFQHLANSFNVRSAPTLLYFKNGQVVGRHVGYADINAIYQDITNYLLS